MSFTQLNPAIPVDVIGPGPSDLGGSGQAIAVIDYSQEHHLLWVVAMNDTGEIWTVPNPSVRLQKNFSLGRNLVRKTKTAEHRPLAGVHDATIYEVLQHRDGGSWFDACNMLEASLVEHGWTPPVGHPLRAKALDHEDDEG